MLHFQTGGGPLETVTTELDAKVLALLGNRAEPLHNPFENDVQYAISAMSSMYHFYIQGGPKKWHHFLYALSYFIKY